MDSARDSKPDLTTTIHLNALRPVGDPEVSPLRHATAEEIEILNQLPDESAMLIALQGPGRGARFLLDSDMTTVGRSPANDIFLDDITVSRKHCEIKRNGRTFVILDHGSLNGTYLDSQLISGEGNLQDGVEVQIGKYRLHFFQGGTRRAINGGEK